MPIFDFKHDDDVQTDEGYLGTVIQVDTRRVLISAEDEHLMRASIGKLVALRRGIVDDWLIGMVERIVRQIVTADTTEKNGEQIDTSNMDALPLSGNTVTVTLVGMMHPSTLEVAVSFIDISYEKQ